MDILAVNAAVINWLSVPLVAKVGYASTYGRCHRSVCGAEGWSQSAIDECAGRWHATRVDVNHKLQAAKNLVDWERYLLSNDKTSRFWWVQRVARCLSLV
jgi:hypothetical protein